MSMLGNLTDFSLPELLRMFEKSSRTGQLSVWGPGGFYRVLFFQGRIVGGVAPETKQSLLKIFSELAGVTLEKKQIASLKEPLGKYLKHQNLVNSATLALAFRHQIRETIYPLFAQEQGQFRFSNKSPIPFEEMTGLSKSSIEISLEGFRALQKKSANPQNLPGLNSTYVRANEELPALKLSSNESRIVEHLSVANNLKYLSQALNIDAIEVQQTCYRLEKVNLLKKLNSVVNEANPAKELELQQRKVSSMAAMQGASQTLSTTPNPLQPKDKKTKSVNSRLLNRFASLLKSI